jgi:hypothetical protein
LKPKTIENYDELMAEIGGLNAAMFVLDNPVYRQMETKDGRIVEVYLDNHGHWVVRELEL